jgi:hypothetical protein
MKARELQLSLEVGITGVFATGSDAYQDGWHDWQRYLALGAPLTALFIDEPITNGSRLSGLSYSTIVQETVNRIVLVRRNPALEYMKVVQRWMPAPHRKLRHFHPRALPADAMAPSGTTESSGSRRRVSAPFCQGKFYSCDAGIHPGWKGKARTPATFLVSISRSDHGGRCVG